jgi:hypothetical protein
MEEGIMIPDNVEVPDFNPELQYLGEPTLDEKKKEWFFPVIDYSESDLKAIKIYKAEFERQKALNIEGEKKILADTLILSDSDALEKQAMFPIWEKLENGYKFTVNEKINCLNDKNEIVLFKVIQSHSKQIDWHPLIVPNLFSEVKIVNGIEVWKQPIGGDGKYPYINPLTTKPYQVSHKESLWENTHTGGLNVWEPGVFGWKKI